MLMPTIPGLRANDSHTWDMAFTLLWPVACSAVHRRLGVASPSAVEEVAIEAIGNASERVFAGEVRDFDGLKALVAVIANRRALDYLRRHQAARRAAGATESIEDHGPLVSTQPGPLERANDRDIERILSALMKVLRGQDRELLTAYLVDGLKQRELAEKFGMKMGTVGVTLSRALSSIREELAAYPALMKEFLEALR